MPEINDSTETDALVVSDNNSQVFSNVQPANHSACTLHDPSSTQTYVFETTSACTDDTRTYFCTNRSLFDEKVDSGNIIPDAHPRNTYEHQPEDIPHCLETSGKLNISKTNDPTKTDVLVISDNNGHLSTNVQLTSCSVHTLPDPLSTQSHTFESSS
jgi:hypothetical protein